MEMAKFYGHTAKENLIHPDLECLLHVRNIRICSELLRYYIDESN